MDTTTATPAHRLRSGLAQTVTAIALAAAIAGCGATTDAAEQQDPRASAPDETEDTSSADESTVTRTPTLTLSPPDRPGCGFPFASEDGLHVFVSRDGRLVHYDVTTGEVVDRGPDPADDCAVWTGDPSTGRKVVDAGRIDGVWLGTLDGDLDVRLDGDRDRRLFSRALVGDRVLFGSKATEESGSILVYDAITGELLAEVPDIAGDFGITFGSDGALLGMTTSTPTGGAAIVLDAATGAELLRVALDAGSEESVFDPAAGQLLVPTADGRLVTIDTETGEVVSEVDRSSQAEVVAVGVRPDGMVVVATTDLLEVVDRSTGPTGISAPADDSLVMRVRPDGTVLRIGFEGEMEVVALEGSGPLLGVAPRG